MRGPDDLTIFLFYLILYHLMPFSILSLLVISAYFLSDLIIYERVTFVSCGAEDQNQPL